MTRGCLKLFVAITAFLWFSELTAQTHIVDATDGSSLPKASVFDRKGNLVAVSSDDGFVPRLDPDLYPITVHFLGYETGRLTSPDFAELRMTPADYPLPELVVSQGDRNMLHLTAYVREYGSMTSSNDTAALFCEKIVDFVIPMTQKAKFKGWDKGRQLASRMTVRKKLPDGTDSIRRSESKLSTIIDAVRMAQKIDVPDALVQGKAGKVTIAGKYSPEYVWHVIGDDYLLDEDRLSDKKGHVYTPNAAKLVGLTLDLRRLDNQFRFKDVRGREATIVDLLSVSTHMEFTGRGKMFKWALGVTPPIEINIYSETFIIDREYLTAEEAKELKNNPPSPSSIKIQAPLYAPQLPPAIAPLQKY